MLYRPKKKARGGEDLMSKVTNIIVELGPRMVMVGKEVMGTSENFSLEVAEATEEELEKLKSAFEIRLVKMSGEGGGKDGVP